MAQAQGPLVTNAGNSSAESIPVLALALPFNWPDPRVTGGVATYAADALAKASFADVTGLAGVFCDPGIDGVEWIARLLADKPTLTCKLLLSLHPACATTAEELRQLLMLQRQ